MSVDEPQPGAEQVRPRYFDRAKCCPGHIGGNRATRRAANKTCPCRGKCGWH